MILTSTKVSVGAKSNFEVFKWCRPKHFSEVNSRGESSFIYWRAEDKNGVRRVSAQTYGLWLLHRTKNEPSLLDWTRREMTTIKISLGHWRCFQARSKQASALDNSPCFMRSRMGCPRDPYPASAFWSQEVGTKPHIGGPIQRKGSWSNPKKKQAEVCLRGRKFESGV